MPRRVQGSRLRTGLAVSGLPTYASIVGFGDSIMAGQLASDAAHRWINIIAAHVGAGTPLNAGIAGTVLQNSNDSGGSPRPDNGRDRYAADVLGANKRDAIFIAYGGNDARYTGAPATMNVTNYINDYREIMDGLLAGGYPKQNIYVLPRMWITDTGLNTGSAGFTGQTRVGFEEYMTATRDIAVEFGANYADIYTYTRYNGGDALVSTDNIHPEDLGHAVIADGVRTARRISPSCFMYDSMTDANNTPIKSHTKYTTWTDYVANGTEAQISNNRLVGLATTNVYVSADEPPTADYYVEAIIDWVSSLSADNVGVAGRMQTGLNTYYFASYSHGATGFRLFKNVAGSSTQLGSTFTDAFSSGSRTVRLNMQGSTIKMLIDGVERASVTDTAITEKGFAGIRSAGTQTGSTGRHITKIVAFG